MRRKRERKRRKGKERQEDGRKVKEEVVERTRKVKRKKGGE